MKYKSLLNRSLKNLLFIIFAAAMVLYFSVSTSPLYPNYKAKDSSFFLVMGREWLGGLIPYKDLWDQKGPAIFFVNLLGFMLTGNKYGVLIIQILFATISAFFIYKILRRSMGELWSVLGACLGIIVFSCNYEGGNLLEEYINPFLIICMYFITDWIHKKSKEKPDHNPLCALFYGITFGLCVMSRVTNSIAVCIAILFIIIYLCANKAWGNLLRNAIAFICGTALVIVPFMIYFAINDCTYDFWYGTILFNLSYTAGANSSLITFIKSATRQIGSYALMGTGFIILFRKRYYDGIMYIAMGIGTQILLKSIFRYDHYSMITFGLLIVSVYELTYTIAENRDIARKMGVFALTGTLLIASYRTGKEIIKMAGKYEAYSANPSEEAVAKYRQLIDFSSQIPEDERGSVVAYNANPTIYLDMDISPACRFFAYQDWQAGFSESYVELLNEEFKTKKPLWIIVYSNKDTYIQGILNTEYEVVSSEPEFSSLEDNTLTLYRLAQ